MTFKRIRNKKIDTQTTYPVKLLQDLDEKRLQFHVQSNVNTGMEDHEKEEVHLKKVLQKSELHIPTPKIEQIEGVIEKYKPLYKKSKEYIKFNDDCPNDYILSEEDLHFCKENNFTEAFFVDYLSQMKDENEKFLQNKIKKQCNSNSSNIGYSNFDTSYISNTSVIGNNSIDNNTIGSNIINRNNIIISNNDGIIEDLSSMVNGITANYNEIQSTPFGLNISQDENSQKITQIMPEKIEKLRDYIQDRILLLYDNNGFNAYACFRRYIIKAARQSRRSETTCIDQIHKVFGEMRYTENLFQIAQHKFETELDLAKTISGISNLGCAQSLLYKNVNASDKKFRRNVMNPILGIKRKEKIVPFYKKCKFATLRFDKNLILELQKVMYEGDKHKKDDIDKAFNLFEYFGSNEM
ncbi:hypothetical protein EDEG_00421 [Edhazardia aedis USNM 41457]|uniref:Uncharacterized protein n=1 Tax=Edhazardia aedis (strain USNM 41457) TaxID=1003232 RepID=J9D1X3_EDHAE|nr:hypothetical protein EDEG_00421 [Edhazardia aedis USNM 41457]|eukprot:EJW01569.1 hypothetical protein EDEG_00421 [Edhazardia aedis USNM 41457]